MPQSSYPRPSSKGKAYPRKSPQQQLEAAIEKCQRDQIAVAGEGTLVTGAHFWIVPSQSVEGLCHVVSQASNKSLTCDCYAGQRGVVCVHRAAAYLRIKAVAATVPATSSMRPIADAAVAQAANAPVRAPQPQEAASPAQRVKQPAKNPATALYGDDTYKGDIFKPERPLERRYQTVEDEYTARDGYASSDYYQHAYR